MYLILAIGAAGQGKSKFINDTFLNNANKPNPNVPNKNLYFPSAHSKSQYVFDVNNEYLLPTDTGQYQQFMRHTECNMKRFMQVAKGLRNYNIVIEDATGFLRGNIGKEFSQLLVSKIHTGNNYIVYFHSINRVPPEIMEMSNYVILFKTVDSIDSLKKFKNNSLTQNFIALQHEKQYSKRIIKLI